MPLPTRAVLVTGASSGIGRATVKSLIESGRHVFAGVRSEAAAAELQAALGDALTPLVLDVTCAEQVKAAAERIEREVPHGLYGVVNNAGLGMPAPLELTDVEELAQLFDVNALGPLRVIQAMLPLLRRGGGRIVNITSMNGTTSLPMVGGYSATKFALEAMSAALRVELRPWGIPVSVIRPGQVRTPIFAKARASIAAAARRVPAELAPGYALPLTRTAKFNERGAKSRTAPDAVARVVLKALSARWPRAQYRVGWDALGLAIAQALLPTLLWDRALARTIGSLGKRPDEPLPGAPHREREPIVQTPRGAAAVEPSLSGP
ncbi:MAG: SDR family oxidoreductase [Pirellulales bacterium]|nr:SDR family oxidoreductase [Pirellulales bacterium]